MANEIIKGMGFHHIAVKALDFDASLKFYTEGLGMKYYTGWGEGNGRIAMLDLGDGGILELFAGAEGDEAINNRYIHFAMKVDDVDAAAADLKAAGIDTFRTAEPNSMPIFGGIRNIFFYGPDGELLELLQHLK